MSNSSSRRGNHRRRAKAPPAVETEITISRLGSGGDGIGDWKGAPVYVPGLLAGERAKVRLGAKRGDGRIAEVLEVLEPAPDRVEPPCAYAGECGGCVVQHMSDDAYLAWKEDILIRALASKRLVPEILLPMVRIDEGRRRLRFAAIGRAHGPVMGFNAKASSQIVDLDACIAATPDLQASPQLIRPLINRLLKPTEKADIDVRSSRAGLDILIVRARPFDLDERQAIADFADTQRVARVTWRSDDQDSPQIIAERKEPELRVGGHSIIPSPGAFLQPTAGGEDAMAAFAARRLAGAKRVADLYAGWGPFALRLANPIHVEAFEGEAAMVEALNRAAGIANLGGHLVGVTRDLARQPLLKDDLKRFDGLLLDPPRSGAAIQCTKLAADGPPKIVYLSCNPAALARDAAILLGGGYRFVEAMPIDQFRWTPHLEVACYFEREPRLAGVAFARP
ncbi:MAG: class I SAM-dependent RNA methyltransferase [Alphaproteobacteria bacterium]